MEITLPADVPEGPADLEVTVTPASTPGGADWRERRSTMLDGLRRLREEFGGRDIRLSEAVIEVRREEG